VRKAYRLLQTITKAAVEEGLLVASPCRVKFQKEPKPTLHCPTKDEVLAIANAVPDRYRALVLLAGFGGLRWGEAIGLCRRHVDLATGSVKVEQTVVEILGEVYLQPYLKTEAGERDVYVPALVREALALHLARWSQAGPSGLVFSATRSANGPAYVRRSNFYRRVWRPTVIKLGLPDVRFHDLRHAAATLAAQGGYTTRELMDHIGHASAAASLRYQHAADDRMRSLPRSIDALIGEPVAATGTDNVIPIRR
jgi:integrase